MTEHFRGWLRRQRHRHDPVGDLARDAAGDVGCGRWATARGLRRHMEDVHGASPAALAALDAAKGEWDATHPVVR